MTGMNINANITGPNTNMPNVGINTPNQNLDGNLNINIK